MNIDIAKRLADRRKRAGFSQESLALELGVSRQAVSKWERSESSPDTDNLIALAQLYGVSLDDLLYKDVEDDPESAIDSEAAVSEGVACDLEGNNAVATCEGASAEAGHAHENDGNESNDPSADQPDGTVDNEGDHNYSRRESDDVHIGPDGIHIESNGKGDSVHISWKDGIHVKDGSHGDEVYVGWDGIRVNDHRYDDWRDAHAHWDGSRKKYPNPAWRNWNVFPYPLLAILAYLAFGLMSDIPGAWFSGIGFFLSIPVYYALGGLLFGKRVCAFFSALYSAIAIEAFILLALGGCVHPGWIVLVSIPFVVGLFNGIAHWWRTRKK